jgi:hypothetical protein
VGFRGIAGEHPMILSFPTVTERAAFLSRVRQDRPEIHDDFHVSTSLPSLVIAADKDVAGWIESVISGYSGQISRDLTFTFDQSPGVL